MATQDAKREQASERREGEGPSGWEWAVAALGLVLVLATIGYLVVDAVSGASSPPDPAVTVVAVQPQGQRFLVRIRVANLGGAPAAGLTVEGKLLKGSEVVEQAQVEIQYLPGHSSQQAGLFFDHDPKALELRLGARSYTEP